MPNTEVVVIALESDEFLAVLSSRVHVTWSMRVGGWLGMPASDKALKVQPEFAHVPPTIVQCFYGEDEKDTLCPALANTGVEVIRTSGDHHFGRDYNALERRILDAFRKQSGVRN